MERKNLILLQLPSPYLLVQKWVLPMTLINIKTYLLSKTYNCNVKIINLAGVKNWQNLIPLDADYYGISAFTPQIKVAKQVIDFLKERSKGKIIIGGHHVTALPVETMENLDPDIVIIGEGEEIIKEIISGKDLSEIMGIAYRDNKNQIIVNDRMPFIKDIDNIPFPKIDEFNLDEYPGMKLLSPNSKYQIGLVTSRGCPHKCIFCDANNFWMNTLRYHSADYLIEQFNYLRSFGINNFRFDDDNFALKTKRLEKLVDNFVSNKSTWHCPIRSDTVTDNLVRLMKESGCTHVSIGVETGSDKMLKLLKKATTVEKHKQAIALLKKYGIKVDTYILLGLPLETEETINETLEFCKTQPIDHFDIATFVPFPGNEIYHNPSKYNFDIENDPLFSNFYTKSNYFPVKSVSEEGNRVLKMQTKLIEFLLERSTNKRAFNFSNNIK